MTERNKAIPAVYILLEKDGKILLGRRCNTGYEDGNYQVPAGHVEDGELLTEAIIREAKEEVGINLNVNDLEFSHISYRPRHDNTDDRIDIFFKTSKWEGEVKNMEPEKCDNLDWFSMDNLPENMTYHVRDAIKCMQKVVFFKEITIADLKAQGLYNL